MSTVMDDDIKRWTAKRKTALVLDIIQGKTTRAEASRSYDLNPSELEQWVEEGKRGMENALRSKPLEVKEHYEKQLRELQEAYGEAMLELRARKKLSSLLGHEDDKRSSMCSRDWPKTGSRSAWSNCAGGSSYPGARCTTARPRRHRRCRNASRGPSRP